MGEYQACMHARSLQLSSVHLRGRSQTWVRGMCHRGSAKHACMGRLGQGRPQGSGLATRCAGMGALAWTPDGGGVWRSRKSHVATCVSQRCGWHVGNRPTEHDAWVSVNTCTKHVWGVPSMHGGVPSMLGVSVNTTCQVISLVADRLGARCASRR